MNCLPYEVDRGVCRFLEIRDFVSFRLISRRHYHDQEAWRIQSLQFPLNISRLNVKKKIALHYLLKWACQFPQPIGSIEWYQNIILWLQHNISIKIMSSFLQEQSYQYDLSQLCVRRRFIWQRQFNDINRRLFKRKRLFVYENIQHKRVRKNFVQSESDLKYYSIC